MSESERHSHEASASSKSAAVVSSRKVWKTPIVIEGALEDAEANGANNADNNTDSS